MIHQTMKEGRKEDQERKCTQNVTFWRVPFIVVAMERQQYYSFYCY